MKHPRARRKALVVEHLGDETLVYDLQSHQAHRLDAIAAAVWRRCDGKASPEDIAAAIAERGARLEPREVEATLVALADAGLLVDVVASRKRGAPVSRRRAAAAVVAGAVTTILAPTVAQAVSTTCLACNKCASAADEGKPCGASPCTTCTCQNGGVECRKIVGGALCIGADC